MHVQVTDHYSSKSLRLLAVACGVILDAQQLDIVRMSQQQIEASAVDMQLLGLVILTNSVRSDSRETVQQIQNE